METENQRLRFVEDWFQSNPFVRHFQLKLVLINGEESAVQMRLQPQHCTADKVITGGMHVLLANAAGVSLAMMNSEHFTPLVEIQEFKFLQPVVWAENERASLVAIAKKVFAKDKRIKIKIKIYDRQGQKATGLLEYALLSRPFETKTPR